MLLIKNGYVIDPKSGLDGRRDILISNGKITEVTGSISDDKAKIIDAKDKLVMPAFIDMHWRPSSQVQGLRQKADLQRCSRCPIRILLRIIRAL